jgi:xylulokinase
MPRRPTPVTIGIDIGTSACKAVVLDARGRVVHTALAGYPTRRGLDGEVTQDARDWLRAVRSNLRECAAASAGRSVDGIGLTAPAHVGVLADEEGEPLARVLLAFDGRPATVVPTLRARYGEALFEATFVDLSAGWTLPQLHWLRGQAPGIWPRIRLLLTQKDWVRYRLTGVPLIDASDAAGTAMLDQRTGAWLEPVCRDLGLGPEQLPAVVPSTTPGGGLSAMWARSTGLPSGTPVVVGATDTAAELVSVGAFERGDALVKIASTGTVVGVSADPVVDRRLLTYPHAVPGRWYTLAATNTAAVAYHWLRETVFASARAEPAVAYAEMDRRAARAPAGAGGVLFLPFLEGERTPWWDPRLRAAFVGLSAAHGRDHLARAVLEGVALSLRSCRDVVEAAGLPVSRPYLAGGGVASRLWRDILVSALGVAGRLTDPQGPAVGAAILAAAAGASDAATVRARCPRPRVATIAPREDWARTYDALHGLHEQAARAVAEVSHRLVAGAANDRAAGAGD